MERDLLRQVQQWVSVHENELIDDLSALVKIRSVSEPNDDYAMGEGCARCGEKAMELAQKYGFSAQNHDYYCVSILMKGRGGGELGILGHLDVVPEGDGWSFDPYGAELREGYLIGRGAGDNKGACVMSMYAMRCIRELGLPLFHDVRLILGFNEESGMKDVEHYLKVMEPPRFTLVCDGAWPMILGEKGILTADLTTRITDGNLLNLQGGITGNSVPDSAAAEVRTLRDAAQLREKSGISVTEIPGGLRIRAEGKACHAMNPEGGVNAIDELAAYLLSEDLVEGDALRAVGFLHQVAGDCFGGGLNIACEDHISGRTTCIVGKARLADGALTININVRYAIEADRKAQQSRLLECCETAGFQAEELRDSPPRYMPEEQEPVPQLLRLYREMTGDMSPPIIMGGGTHARLFPNALPFGPGHWGEPGKFGGAHAVDEAVCLKHLTEAIPVYVAALLELDAFFSHERSKSCGEEKYV